MAKSQIIRTSRLIIEPFSGKHLTERYVSWLNNPTVVCYSEQRHQKHTVESCRRYVKSFEDTPNYFWAISVVDRNLLHIGNINAYVDKINRIADIGILIGEIKAWGQGYATEAWKAVCNYLFEELKIRKITAGTVALNSAMLKLMKRVGMVDDGRRVRHYLFEGSEIDVVCAALFKDNWKGATP